MTTDGLLCRKLLPRRLTAVLILFLLASTHLWPQEASSGVRWVVSQEQIPPVAWGVYDLQSRKWVNQAEGRWGSASAPPGQYSVYVRWTPETPLEWWAMVEVYDGTFTPLQSRRPLALFNGIAQLVQNAYVEPPRMERALDGALVAMLEFARSLLELCQRRYLQSSGPSAPGLPWPDCQQTLRATFMWSLWWRGVRRTKLGFSRAPSLNRSTGPPLLS